MCMSSTRLMDNANLMHLYRMRHAQQRLRHTNVSTILPYRYCSYSALNIKNVAAHTASYSTSSSTGSGLRNNSHGSSRFLGISRCFHSAAISCVDAVPDSSAADGNALQENQTLEELLTDARSLRRRYYNTGDIPYLEEAAEKIKACLPLINLEDPQLPEDAWRMLTLPFEVSGDHEVLNQAISLLLRAVKNSPDGGKIRITTVLALSHALNLHSNHTLDRETRTEVITTCDACMESTHPDNTDLALIYLSMQGAMRLAYLNVNPGGQVQLGVGFGYQAMKLLPQDHPRRAEVLTELAVSLRIQHDEDKQRPVLDEAIRLLKEAVKLDMDPLYRPWVLVNLGICLHTLSRDPEFSNHLPDAIQCFIDALKLQPPNSPERPYTLMCLGFSFGKINVVGVDESRSKAQAAEFFEEALRTLPERHPLRARCEHYLKEMQE
jgi:tetratricopeptide (TPR) repeat protein